MFITIKGIKGLPDELKHKDSVYNDLFSKAESAIWQPIDSLFNWLIQITDIHRATKIGATKGIIVHVFGRIAAAFISIIFNINSHNQ